jgi:hypothetical protein
VRDYRIREIASGVKVFKCILPVRVGIRGGKRLLTLWVSQEQLHIGARDYDWRQVWIFGILASSQSMYHTTGGRRRFLCLNEDIFLYSFARRDKCRAVTDKVNIINPLIGYYPVGNVAAWGDVIYLVPTSLACGRGKERRLVRIAVEYPYNRTRDRYK